MIYIHNLTILDRIGQFGVFLLGVASARLAFETVTEPADMTATWIVFGLGVACIIISALRFRWGKTDE